MVYSQLHFMPTFYKQIFLQYRHDKISYFANVFLGQIKGDVKFYRKKQVGYTMSLISKEVTKLVRLNPGIS